MRQNFYKAYEDIDNLLQHRQILAMTPISAQQSYVQTLSNILLCANKQSVGEIINLLSTYKGSLSHLILNMKYCTYCMEKDLNKNFYFFNILKQLSKWVETHEAMKKNKDIRLYQSVIETLDLGACTYEEFIIYLNYISNDLVNLLKSGSQETQKKYTDISQHPHLDAKDLTKFLNVALPKVLTNIIIPRTFFPPTLLKSTDESVDLLYCNQILQNIAQNKTYYNLLLRAIFKVLISMQLEPSQIKQLILCSFKYYYLFHHDKNCSASQFVIESLKKMSSAVRFAIMDEIALFIIILKKLGKQLFVNYLSEKFGWISQLLKNNHIIGINKSTIKPYYNQGFNNALKVKIEARKIQQYYIEIYDRFSLLFFYINCVEYDITTRFYFLGNFDKQESTNEKKLLFSSDKKQGLLEGSIQTIETGIYMFEFDNSYSWMKGKTINLEYAILVPLEIKEHAKSKLKSLVFEKYENMNEVPFENVSGWIDQSQIKINSTSANVTVTTDANFKVYNVKLIKNTGQAYEYQTQAKSRFVRKIRQIEKDPHIFWLIQGFKVKSTEEIQKWLDGEFQPDKLVTYQQGSKLEMREDIQFEPEQPNQIKQMHEQLKSEESSTSFLTNKQQVITEEPNKQTNRKQAMQNAANNVQINNQQNQKHQEKQHQQQNQQKQYKQQNEQQKQKQKQIEFIKESEKQAEEKQQQLKQNKKQKEEENLATKEKNDENNIEKKIEVNQQNQEKNRQENNVNNQSGENRKQNPDNKQQIQA